jgi:hypothetical protein
LILFTGGPRSSKLRDAFTVTEKAKVYVVIPDVEIPPFAYIGSPRLAHLEQAADFEKEVIEEIKDASV